jgi:diguanylate cyclase (GGDEF)-like protein/putative nucleotidyltransferase with HDIG domain
MASALDFDFDSSDLRDLHLRWTRRAFGFRRAFQSRSGKSLWQRVFAAFHHQERRREERKTAAMDLRAKAFIALMVASGVAVVGPEMMHPSWPALGKFLGYLLVVCFASQLKVVLPGINGTMSVNLVVILVSVVELSLPETLVVGCLGALIQTWWQRKQINLLHLAFNTGDIAIAISLCYWFFHSAAAWVPQMELRLMATAIIYFLANTLPVAGIVALTERKVFHKTWAECYLWSFPNYLVGAAIAGLITWSNARMGWQTSLLMVPVAYLIYRSYRLYFGKLEDEKKHVERIAELHLRTIEALALAIDAKDHTTHVHLKRVRVYAEGIGKEMGLSGLEMEALRAAALLHDIGKLAVPEHIINKPGRLSEEEFEKMKIHPIVGAEILERVNFPYPVAPIVRSHHERWDGSGYPDGLKGAQIPIGARILAAVDCLDAIASDRQYRRGVALKDSVAELVRQSGAQFDPRVVEVIQRRFPQWELQAENGGGIVPERLKLSTDLKLHPGGAPAAGYEQARTGENCELDFLASIVAARYEAQALLEFSNDLGRSLSLEETLSVVAARVRKLVPYDAIAIYRVREKSLVADYATGDDYRVFSGLKIPMGEGVSGWVAENRKPIINGNPSVEPGYLDNQQRVERMGSALAVPLVGSDDSLLGVLTLYKLQADAFCTDHLRILLAISEKIGASIANAAKYQDATDSATTDYLTGLPNARSLFLQLESEISRCQRDKGRLGVILCDLDGFKQVNDQYGHMAGNQVLKTFARKLKVACREYDYISRMGGDEFVILAPGLKASDVPTVRDRIRAAAAVSAEEICGAIEFSASVGISFSPDDSRHAAQLLVEADKRMYEMKKSRRFSGTFLAPPPQTMMTQ